LITNKDDSMDQQSERPAQGDNYESRLEPITSRLWFERADDNNPFVAQQCLCAGFNLFEDVLGKAHWVEYLFLLFTQRQATALEARLLNDLAIALGNPGPRDHGVQAAMSAAAGGSTMAACLMAAIAVGAGQLGGAREIYYCMLLWQECCQDLAKWQTQLKHKQYLDYNQRHNGHCFDVWPALEHAPGFSPHGGECALPVQQTLTHLANITGETPASNLRWLALHRRALEQASGQPLAITGVAAATFCDLQLDAQQAELLFLLLRLPGAAAHALEQHRLGWRDYPFHPHGIKLTPESQQGTDATANSTPATP
jgi:citrate synthase